MNTEYSQTSLASDEIGTDVKQQIAEKKKQRRKYRWISIALVIVILISVVGLIGSLWTGWISISAKQYYIVKGRKAIGTMIIENNQYYFDDAGVMQTGWHTIEGDVYYFGDDGIMQTGWLDVSENKYYLNSSGAMQTGWQSINGEKYYFGGKGTMQTGWQTVDGNTYYFGDDGIVQTGFQMIGAKQYYLDNNGVLQLGWLTVNGNNYYCSESKDGALATGKWTINGENYYFDNNGIMVTGTAEISKNNVYYFDDKGHFQYRDVTETNISTRSSDSQVTFKNRSGGNTYSFAQILNHPIENCMYIKGAVSLSNIKYGTGNGTWQIHVRTPDGKWKRLGYYDVIDGKGTFDITFDTTISFDAYVCTRYDGGDAWSGSLNQDISELCYRTYDFGSGGNSE